MTTTNHPAPYHIDIYCNSCNVNPIRGIRLKCTTCKKFNLCLNCFSYDFGHVPAHRFEAMKECTLTKQNKPSSPAIKTTEPLVPYFGTQSNPPTTGTNDRTFIYRPQNNNNNNNNNTQKPPDNRVVEVESRTFTFGTSPKSNGSPTFTFDGNSKFQPTSNSNTQNSTLFTFNTNNTNPNESSYYNPTATTPNQSYSFTSTNSSIFSSFGNNNNNNSSNNNTNFFGRPTNTSTNTFIPESHHTTPSFGGFSLSSSNSMDVHNI